MPLRAVSNTVNIHAFEFDAPRWSDLKADYRHLGLRMPCCDSSAIPKTSPLGNNFFAHARKGDCSSAPESAEHLYCKQLIAEAALSIGWHVVTEWPGKTPDGEEWIADVFCQQGKAKVAFEVQISPQTHEETQRRQARYLASGVRGAWFYSSRIRPNSVAPDKSTPAFVLAPFEVGHVPFVQGFNVPLPEFVVGMLTKRLAWNIPEYIKPIYVEFMSDTCWACEKPVMQVYGHLTERDLDENGNEIQGWHPRAFTVASLSSALEALHVLVTNEELAAAGLNSVRKRDVVRGKPTNWPYCNQCLHCHAPQDNFHVGEKVWKQRYSMDDSNEGHLGLVQFKRMKLGVGRWQFLPQGSCHD